MASIRSAAEKFFGILRSSGPLWAGARALERAGVRTSGWWPDASVSVGTLSGQIASIFRAWGMPEDHIGIATSHLIYADLHGIESHGSGMMMHYHRGRAAGALEMAPKIEVVRENDTTALVDGGGGIGHVPADTAMKLAIAKCRDAGIAAVAVRNSGHFGAAGSYAAMASNAGLIGLVTCNTGTPAIVPTFGADAALGTNPIAFAAPAARNQAFLLDMATSVVPYGKLVTAWRRGQSIPDGWALDSNGVPVTDARKAMDHRRLTPLGGERASGGHKGYGLAAAVEILSSVLPGLRAEAPIQRADWLVGHFFLVLDPRRFRAAGEFEADLDGLLDGLRTGRSLDPAQPILVAGDPEYAAAEERGRSGIPLSRSVIEDIRTICRASGAPFILVKKD